MHQSLHRWAEVSGKCSLFINKKLFFLSCLCAGLMAVPTTIDVMGSLLFHKALTCSTELVEFLQVVVLFGGLGYVHDKRAHVYVEMILDKMPETWRPAFRLAFIGAAAVLFTVMARQLFLTGLDRFSSGEVSYDLHIPEYIFVLFAALGTLAAVVSFVADIIGELASLLEKKAFRPLLFGIAFLAVIVSSPWWISSLPFAADKLLLGAFCMAAMLTLLLVGMPIGVAMLLMGFVGLLVAFPTPRPALALLGSAPYTTGATYLYSVVPMFILMGELAMYSGISRDLFNTANIWLGRLPGGLAVATVSGCAGFAAVSGDSMATAVTMSSVALPEMRAKKYDPGFSCATLAAGGTLGILIPPSTGFIFYSLVTEVSIGKLFVAGIVPGLLLAALFILVVLVFAGRYPELAPRGQVYSWPEKVKSLAGVLPMILLITLVLGGILFGFFSPNQGGAVGAVGTLVFAMCRRRISWENFKKALVSTAFVTSKMMLILVGVGVLGNFFAATRLPFALAELVAELGASHFAMFVAIVIAYIVLGCMMNVIPMVLLTLPAIYPSVEAVGFDGVWFGVVCVVLMEMGQITPPVGINVFAISSAAEDVPMVRIFRHIVPYFLAMMALVFLLYLFPELATWLPGLLF